MLLAVDTGNTHTVLGLFEGTVLRADWRIATRRDATADELSATIGALFAGKGIPPSAVRGVIVSSVVPDWDRLLAETLERTFGTSAVFVGPGIKTGLPILYENPHEVGADRIVNAVAAVHRFGAPVIVLDFGTATTFDVVGPKGEYLGGVIAPGLGISAEALFTRAARLTRVELRKPPRAIGRTTQESVQSGLFFGYVALVEGVVRRLRAELAAEAPVVATGGLVEVFRDELPLLAAIDPHLTLEGLRLIWEKNRR
ncbi:MAG TPA: type III pantothenate kinase [Candidatus Sulfotelmatobacter sp.]|jgi:type III pantothenate kinase|nr:type III pantothenate kinase [Candidatus Sulfotelmatobacter sp.]